MDEGSTDRLEVGRVARAHGLRGEVAIVPITNRAERFAVGSVLWVDGRACTVETSRTHQDRVLVRFSGVEDRNGAEALRGAVLTAAPLPGAPGERWVHELVGRRVVDRAGARLGRVTAVQANPAHDLLVLDDRVLLPMPFLVDDTGADLVVDPPDGLLELFEEG